MVAYEILFSLRQSLLKGTLAPLLKIHHIGVRVLWRETLTEGKIGYKLLIFVLSAKVFIFSDFNGNGSAGKAKVFPQTVFHKAQIGKMNIILGAEAYYKSGRVSSNLLEFVNSRMLDALAFGWPMNLY